MADEQIGGVEISDGDRLVANPVVSILLMTYNQEDYVSDALDSFLAQKTDFPFEILVNEDCSPDGTLDVLLSYQRRFPETIRVVSHAENQYQRGGKPWGDFLLPRARGEFIALCEGDDYWTDERKLQRQYDVMRENPGLSACAHASENVRAESRQRLSVTRFQDHDGRVGSSDVLTHVQCFATNSLFFRRQTFVDFRNSVFDGLEADGDQRLTVYLGITGEGIYYIDEVMSAYRVLARGSTNQANFLSERRIQIAEQNRARRVELLEAVDEYARGALHDDVARGIDVMDYAYYKDIRDWKTLRARWPRLLAQESLPARADIFLFTYARPLHRLLFKIVYRL